MRVLHLINAFNRGGLETWLLTMLRHVSRDICAMDVLCKGSDVGPWTPRAQELGARVYHCPLTPFHLGFLKGFRRILAEGEYDLVHNHLGVYSGFPVWVAHREGVPVITLFHNTHFPRAEVPWLRLPVVHQLRRIYGRISMRYAARESDVVSGVSQGVVETIVHAVKEPLSRPSILYLGVESPKPATTAHKEAFLLSQDLPADSLLILHVGRFFEQKNHGAVVSIFERVRSVCPQARLLLVGEGVLQRTTEKLVHERGLSDVVRFLGRRDDVPLLMSMSEVFLLPSLHEGLPIVALEAAAAGLPMVASRIPGLLEASDNGRTALLHDVTDIDGMAESVEELLTDRSFARGLADTAGAHFSETFSTEAAAGRLVNQYRGLLDLNVLGNRSAGDGQIDHRRTVSQADKGT